MRNHGIIQYAQKIRIWVRVSNTAMNSLCDLGWVISWGLFFFFLLQNMRIVARKSPRFFSCSEKFPIYFLIICSMSIVWSCLESRKNEEFRNGSRGCVLLCSLWVTQQSCRSEAGINHEFIVLLGTSRITVKYLLGAMQKYCFED